MDQHFPFSDITQSPPSSRRYVFGPIPSRRLGLSLGVDVIPKKLCNLDCVYCELGRTDKRAMKRQEYFAAKEIIAELQDVVGKVGRVDYITFSGSGEPTLNSKLGEVIRTVKTMTSVPVAVITNGTLLYQSDVREDLLAADIVLPSLDAVTNEMFYKVNRPHPKLSLGMILSGLKMFRSEYRGQLWLEILLVKGLNDSTEEVLLIKDIVEEIRPDKIQLNTVLRPPSEPWAQPVEMERMREIQSLLGERCEIIASTVPENLPQGIPHVESILGILHRRPMTVDELAASFGIPLNQMKAVLEVLEQNGLVVSYHFGSRTYFRPIEHYFSGLCG
ncbi:MAG TPA: radical SAM protein [Bacteroidota bacterium]|nr:radical SAM protein [Bacteroidota bacterium]